MSWWFKCQDIQALHAVAVCLHLTSAMKQLSYDMASSGDRMIAQSEYSNISFRPVACACVCLQSGIQVCLWDSRGMSHIYESSKPYFIRQTFDIIHSVWQGFVMQSITRMHSIHMAARWGMIRNMLVF